MQDTTSAYNLRILLKTLRLFRLTVTDNKNWHKGMLYKFPILNLLLVITLLMVCKYMCEKIFKVHRSNQES